MSPNYLSSGLLYIVSAGILGAGGLYLYKYPRTITWKEYLERKGFAFVSADNSYKALFVDNEDIRKNIDDLKEESDISNNSHTTLKEWCDKELQDIYDKNSNTEEQLISLCSYKGINTVKGRIFQAGKTEWLKEDDQYKSVFAVYRYSEEFLNWLNEGKDESNKIKQSDKPSEKYTDLKNKCETESKIKGLNKAISIYNNIYWWCTTEAYSKTVKDRIQKVDTSWQQETDGSKIKRSWENSSIIKDLIKLSPEASDYKSWCDDQLTKELKEDDIYQEKYLKIKSICKRKSEGTEESKLEIEKEYRLFEDSAEITDNENFGKITFSKQYGYDSKPVNKTSGYTDRNKVKDPLRGETYFTKKELIELLKRIALGSIDDPLIMQICWGVYVEFPENKKPVFKNLNSNLTVSDMSYRPIVAGTRETNLTRTINPIIDSNSSRFVFYKNASYGGEEYSPYGNTFPFLASKDQLILGYTNESNIVNDEDAKLLINNWFNNWNIEKDEIGDIYFYDYIDNAEVNTSSEKNNESPAITVFKVLNGKAYRFGLLMRNYAPEKSMKGKFGITFRTWYNSLIQSGYSYAAKIGGRRLSEWIWQFHILDKQRDELKKTDNPNSLYQSGHKHINSSNWNRWGEYINMRSDNDLPVYERINNVKITYKDFTSYANKK